MLALECKNILSLFWGISEEEWGAKEIYLKGMNIYSSEVSFNRIKEKDKPLPMSMTYSEISCFNHYVKVILKVNTSEVWCRCTFVFLYLELKDRQVSKIVGENGDK